MPGVILTPTESLTSSTNKPQYVSTGDRFRVEEGQGWIDSVQHGGPLTWQLSLQGQWLTTFSRPGFSWLLSRGAKFDLGLSMFMVFACCLPILITYPSHLSITLCVAFFVSYLFLSANIFQFLTDKQLTVDMDLLPFIGCCFKTTHHMHTLLGQLLIVPVLQTGYCDYLSMRYKYIKPRKKNRHW